MNQKQHFKKLQNISLLVWEKNEAKCSVNFPTQNYVNKAVDVNMCHTSFYLINYEYVTLALSSFFKIPGNH